MTTAPPTVADPDLAEMVLKALDRSDGPINATQLSKAFSGPYRTDAKDLEALLEELVARGRVHRFAPYRSKQHRYWTRDLAQYTRATLSERLTRTPMTKAEAIKAVQSSLKDQSAAQLGRTFDELLAEKQLRKLPWLIGSRSTRYGTRPPDPAEYLQDALDKVAEALAKDGITRADVDLALVKLSRRATGNVVEPNAGSMGRGARQVILDHLAVLDPARRGALVPIEDVRREVADRVSDKAAFDGAVIELARSGEVALHRTDDPGGLGHLEREGMVSDGQGGYFIGIALRG